MMSSISAERVRELRGQASRAAFARQLGVTPNTVYRWELPDGAAEARRPRGTELEKLSRLRPGDATSAAGRKAQPAAQGLAQATGAALSDDLAGALVSVERVLSGEARRGQTEL